MNTIFADAVLNASGTSPLHKHSKTDKLIEKTPSIVFNGIVGGLYTWATFACCAAGGGWVILGAFCAMGVVGTVIAIGASIYYVMSDL